MDARDGDRRAICRLMVVSGVRWRPKERYDYDQDQKVAHHDNGYAKVKKKKTKLFCTVDRPSSNYYEMACLLFFKGLVVLNLPRERRIRHGLLQLTIIDQEWKNPC